jgi:DNA-3-methyladenine glycosylase
LPRSCYDRPVLEVAPDLLGAVVEHAGVRLMITEVEAYDGAKDAASHAFRGETPRNAVMFGPAGHAYVYFTYGMHYCVNLVCGPTGTAAAVLLRAGRVIEGVDVARERRAGTRDRDLARGPARLTKAMAIDRAQNGLDVTRGDGVLRVVRGDSIPHDQVLTGPRIGIAQAADLPWRYWIDGDPTVSPYRPHVPKRRTVAR